MDSMAICRAVMAVDSSSWCFGLERFEISVQLPLGDVQAEVTPFGPLGFHEVPVDVVAERVADHRVALQLIDRLAERARHLPDSHLEDPGGIDLEQALLDRRAQLELLLHPV